MLLYRVLSIKSQSSTVTSTRPVDTHIIKLQTSNRQQIQDNTQGIIQKYNQEDKESASVYLWIIYAADQR